MNQPKPDTLSRQPYYLCNGRIYSEDGQPVFTDRVFADALEADYWLTFINAEAQFGTAYIAGAINL